MAPPTRPKRRTGDYGGRKYTPRRKVCAFCVDKIDEVDYKDVGRLRRFLSDRGKIEPRRKTGTCAPHQRSLNLALKRARHLALLPFTAEHIRITGVVIREPGQGRGDRRPRPVEGVEAPAPDGVAAAEGTEQGAGTAPPTTGPEAVAESTAAQGTGETPAPAGSGS